MRPTKERSVQRLRPKSAACAAHAIAAADLLESQRAVRVGELVEHALAHLERRLGRRMRSRGGRRESS